VIVLTAGIKRATLRALVPGGGVFGSADLLASAALLPRLMSRRCWRRCGGSTLCALFPGQGLVGWRLRGLVGSKLSPPRLVVKAARALDHLGSEGGRGLGADWQRRAATFGEKRGRRRLTQGACVRACAREVCVDRTGIDWQGKGRI
jgi:hypothetical protein